MKIMNYKFIKGAFMSLAVLMAVGCDEDVVSNPDATFVQLNDDRGVTILENGGVTVEIDVILGGPQGSDTQIELDVTGDPTRFTLSASSFSIPAGETTATVTLTAVDDEDINGDLDVVVALSTSSGLPVGLAGQGVNSVSKTITIVDDNVPCNDYVITVVVDQWGSECMYDLLDSNGDVVLSGGPFTDGAAGTTITEVVAANLEDGCYTFRVFDWYGDSWSAGGASYSLACGAIVIAGDDTFDGISGLDINTVPVNPLYGTKFRASGNDSDPYTAHAEQLEFCVNQ
jgi:hypothetical protein